MEKQNSKNIMKLVSLSEQVSLLSLSMLAVQMKFLNYAISQLKPAFSFDLKSYAGNGAFFYYNPIHVLRQYKEDEKSMVYAYLHALLHWIYKHPFVGQSMDFALWDLACDMAVADSILSFTDPSLGLCNRISEEAKKELDYLREKVKVLSAERIYAHFKEEPPAKEDRLRLYALFFVDDHVLWYADDDSGKETGATLPKNVKGDLLQGAGSNINAETGESLNELWDDISKRMQTDLETFGAGKGMETGSIVEHLKTVNRERYDYATFLRQFAAIGEHMSINDEEFDYIFYTYGMELYGNIPLIEPLEYREEHRIKDFVIAIDTSGSVKGDLVSAFLTKTYKILKQEDGFFSSFNLTILQCDSEIKDEVRIKSQSEFDKYISNIKLFGFGGTDFNPVFKRVDKLIADGEFSNLKGLIYLTDGYGTFPEKKPAYESAFVFVEGFYDIPDIPPWAIKIVLRAEDVKKLDA